MAKAKLINGKYTYNDDPRWKYVRGLFQKLMERLTNVGMTSYLD